MTSSPAAIATRPCFSSFTSINSDSSTLVVIDSNVVDYQMLVSGVLFDASVVVLDGDLDGVNQITAILQQYSSVKDLHIVSHGAPGTLYLGDNLLNSDTIDRYAQGLQSWAVESVLIYGCQVAAGNVGKAFLDKLHRLTGAAIAASTTKTGNAALDGNWQLEVAVGSPHRSLAFDETTQQQYRGVLSLLNANDYAALKALYQGTNGVNWTNNTGWKDWDFSSSTPPDLSVVSQWQGLLLDGDRVTTISLTNNNLAGSLPTELGNLSNLQDLTFNKNQLNGSIPSSLGNLNKLEIIALNNNQLSGSIPSELGSLSTLKTLNLSSNQLSGSLPTELGNLSNLQDFTLSSNQLSGSIPAGFGGLSSLKSFSLSTNQLSGSIPVELGNLTNLTSIALNNNQLSGSIPAGFGSLSNLTALTLNNNQLTGSIPVELGSLSNLKTLILQFNQLTGSIPVELGNLSNLTRLNLRDNQLSGNIPVQLGNLSNVTFINLGNNQLSGTIPSQLGNLSKLNTLYLFSNQLSGQLPQAIATRIGSSVTTYDLDNSPFVSTIADQSTTAGQSVALNLSVSDIDTAGSSDPSVLALKAVSDNLTLLSESGISFSGTGSDRILTLTPNAGQTGTANVILTLQDDSGETIEKILTMTVGLAGTVTELFDPSKNEFVVSGALLSLNEETLVPGSLFRSRNGTAKIDKLHGTGRNDAIFGRGNNDLLRGRGGNDFLAGGKAKDEVKGDAGNDLLFGGRGNDILVGGTGSDTLIGDFGADRITTGAGRDKVAFDRLTSSINADTITDFSVKLDVLVVSAQSFGGGLIAGQSISKEQFYIGDRAIGAEDRFIYNRRTGVLSFDADGSGSGKAIAFADLKVGLNLSSQNITVV
ncbi:MAG TPA: DUF4347 domain-containing protein [Coleofasciculaceae cyanobacterium]|jgi:Leucine-rich repeat (LRR) protein